LSRPDPDSELVARVGRGDEAAVRAMVTAKLPRIVSLSARLLGDRGEAEDVAQEVFLRIWRHAARWQPGRALFDTWLHMVTLNLCRDRLRRRRERTVAQLPDRPDPSPAADEAMGEAETSRSVAAAIEALPERQRDAILLVHYQDMTNIAAADAMGIGVEALESLLARGRRSLRKTLAVEETDDD
jgi:RNA polymerase sigma-70 factor (ECF subfamily)